MCVFQLQIPSVKGFDFAKQHLGQHNKDDILIIHEPAPLPGPMKDHTTPSENGDVPSPKAKIPSKNIRHRGRFLLLFLYCSLWHAHFRVWSVSFQKGKAGLAASAVQASRLEDRQHFAQSQYTRGLWIPSAEYQGSALFPQNV